MTTVQEAEQHQIELPKEGEEPAFLPHPLLDQLLDSVIALSAELWIERDRRYVVEAMLADKGILDPAEIENYRRSAEQQALRDACKGKLIERTLGRLKASTK